MMNELTRFGNKIFGSGSLEKRKLQGNLNNRKRKRKSSAKSTNKRKQQQNTDESLSLSITRRSLNESLEVRKFQTFISPDKKSILEHLSCNLDEFSKEPGSDASNSSDEFTFPKESENTTIEPDHFSPAIDDFSDGEDIFDVSHEGDQIKRINSEIVDIYHQKPKYKPINKFPQTGGLLEQFLMAKTNRLIGGCHYAKAEDDSKNQRKIEIFDHCDFRRRLLISFKFNVDFEIIDFEKPLHHHYMVVPLSFQNFLKNHTVFDVIFDLPKREFISDHFIHFGKLFKAGRIV